MYKNYNSIKSKLMYKPIKAFTDGYTKAIELFCIYLVISFALVMMFKQDYLMYWTVISFILCLWVMYISYTNIQNLYQVKQQRIKELEVMVLEAYFKGKALDTSPVEFDKYWDQSKAATCPSMMAINSMEDLMYFCNELEKAELLLPNYYQEAQENLAKTKDRI